MRMSIVLLFFLGLWLLLSGVYKPLVIIFGLCSVFLVIYITVRMNRVDDHQIKVDLNIYKTMKYIFWLFGEIVKSNIAVAKVLLARRVSINQKFLTIPFSQKTELAQVIYANSITLTPGTVTIEVENRALLVHALNETDGTNDDLLKMDEQVSRIESM